MLIKKSLLQCIDSLHAISLALTGRYPSHHPSPIGLNRWHYMQTDTHLFISILQEWESLPWMYSCHTYIYILIKYEYWRAQASQYRWQPQCWLNDDGLLVRMSEKPCKWREIAPTVNEKLRIFFSSMKFFLYWSLLVDDFMVFLYGNAAKDDYIALKWLICQYAFQFQFIHFTIPFSLNGISRNNFIIIMTAVNICWGYIYTGKG